MARTPKPMNLADGHFTAAEREKRTKAENMLAGKNEYVNMVPLDISVEAQSYYSYFIKNLNESGIPISNLDQPLLKSACVCCAIIDECDVQIAQSGLVQHYTNKNGSTNLTESIYLKLRRDHIAQFLSIAGKLGLDPSSRARIAFEQADEIIKENDPLLQALGL